MAGRPGDETLWGRNSRRDSLSSLVSKRERSSVLVFVFATDAKRKQSYPPTTPPSRVVYMG